MPNMMKIHNSSLSPPPVQTEADSSDQIPKAYSPDVEKEFETEDRACGIRPDCGNRMFRAVRACSDQPYTAGSFTRGIAADSFSRHGRRTAAETAGNSVMNAPKRQNEIWIDRLNAEKRLPHEEWTELLSTWDDSDREYAAGIARELATARFGTLNGFPTR